MARFLLFFSFLVSSLLIGGAVAWAGDAGDVSDVADNILDSIHQMPAFIRAIAYLLGILFGAAGIIKLKEHVENASQNNLRDPAARLLIGGALFSLPTIYDAVAYTISGGQDGNVGAYDGGLIASIFGGLSNAMNMVNDFFNEFAGGILGFIVSVPLDLNMAIQSIQESLGGVPAFILGIAYIFGLILAVQGLLKLKEHIEKPDQHPMREGIIRLLVGGAFLSLGTIFLAMRTTISGNTPEGTGSLLEQIDGIIDQFSSEYDSGGCGQEVIGGLAHMLGIGDDGSETLGAAFCNVITHTGALPSLLYFLAYIFGMILGYWGIVKIRDHVTDPAKTPLWDGAMRLLAGGSFFSLPFVIQIIENSIAPSEGLFDNAVTDKGYGVGGVCDTDSLLDMAINTVSNFFGIGSSAPAVPEGMALDMYCAVTDVMLPFHVVLNFFTMIAGVVLIMIGVSRLLKTAQDGARGPGGIGTMMTFVTGGMLLSYNQFMRMVTGTFFGSSQTKTAADLSAYEGAMSASEVMHAQLVMAAIIKFMIIIGLVSFVRGIFIVRGVAEGNNQASMMAGLTHIFGGALAVNLGSVINLVQATLGIDSQFAILFR